LFAHFTVLKEDAIILKHHLRSSWGPWIEDKFFALIKLLIFLMPKSIQVLLKLFQPQWLDFKPYKMLAELPCEVMYDDKAVSSARWHGVKGLGSELVRRSEDIARSRGCSHTYALVTGNYSAKIFDKLGHTLIKAVNYSDFKDSRGEHYLKVKIITQISFKTNQLYLLSFISHYSIGHKRTCASESLPEGSVRSCQYVKCRQLKLGEKKTNLITEV